MALDRGVWSEREAGDWEACVVTCYAMGLLHGGVKMVAPYTQIERERLEKVKDEPQDLDTTDTMSRLVYKVRLRPPSVTSIAAALGRSGVGMCLTGRGSPGHQWQPGFAGLHEVFWIGLTPLAGDLYDPLAPMFQPPERVAVSKMGAWVVGIGPTQAREVRKDEFITGDDVPFIPTAQFAHLFNKKSSLKSAAALKAEPNSASATLRSYNSGTGFFPVVSVSNQWFGCWLYDDSPAGYTFGYFPAGSCNPLVTNENPPDEGGDNGFTQGDIDAAVDAALSSRDDEWTDHIIATLSPEKEA